MPRADSPGNGYSPFVPHGRRATSRNLAMLATVYLLTGFGVAGLSTLVTLVAVRPGGESGARRRVACEYRL